jgi:hypothetical protein
MRVAAVWLALVAACGCSTKRSRSLELTNEGNRELAVQHYETALADFRQALAIDPANTTARYSIARTYKEQKRWPEAIVAFRELQAILPDDATIKRDLGEAEAEQRKLEAAAQKPEPKPEPPAQSPTASPSDKAATEPVGLEGLGLEKGSSGVSYYRNVNERLHSADVVLGQPQVRGALDRELVRRIIRRHINEVRFCYERELLKKADVKGSLTVQFTVAGSGAVVASVVQSSTLDNADVEQCVAGVVRRWEFPEIQGIAIVSAPFSFKTSAAK